MSNSVRVRFAPSPTGFLHLGNVRVALINYLFAHQKKACPEPVEGASSQSGRRGIFILRIEDTDQSRNLDEAVPEILNDLNWLGLKHDEGPLAKGKYGPYFQSKRIDIYQKHLNDLIENTKVYRCFCTVEQLEEKRKEQIAQKQPPRYDRTCLHLSDDHIKQKIAAGQKFIWRLKLNEDQVFDIKEMARGIVHFEMKNFSDFALTREDGSFTFMFTNFVDDWLMKVTHVIRGEDHLTNTALQAALFSAFAVPLPTFWHLPMLCSQEGKKLCKRDFGFSLIDLRKDGFLPQAICNYLAIVGGTFEQEIQSLGELAQNFDFENIHSTGSIHFDLEKLTWINHKWIERLSSEKLAEFIKPFLYEQIPSSKNLDDDKLQFILSKIKTDLKTLKDIGGVLEFYFQAPKVEKAQIEQELDHEKSSVFFEVLKKNLEHCSKIDFFLQELKSDGRERGLKFKEIFGPLRYLFTGKFSGPSVHDLMEILDDDEIERRLRSLF